MCANVMCCYSDVCKNKKFKTRSLWGRFWKYLDTGGGILPAGRVQRLIRKNGQCFYLSPPVRWCDVNGRIKSPAGSTFYTNLITSLVYTLYGNLFNILKRKPN